MMISLNMAQTFLPCFSGDCLDLSVVALLYITDSSFQALTQFSTCMHQEVMQHVQNTAAALPAFAVSS